MKNKNNDKPMICYQCQKVFHRNCLNDWDKKCKSENNDFNCPICKYVLPFKDWKEKIKFEDDRKIEVNIMEEINKNKLKENLNKHINR